MAKKSTAKLRLVRGDKLKQAPKLTAVEKAYFKALHEIVDKIYEEATNSFEWTWGQLATNAGLAPQTVNRLGDRETRYPRYNTIYRLARAVGWELSVVEGQQLVRKAAKLKMASAG